MLGNARRKRIFKASVDNPRLLSAFERTDLDDGSGRGEEGEENVEVTREMILEQAREEAAEKVREAYAEGLRRGVEAAQQEFAERVSGALESLEAAFAAMQQARDEFLLSLEPQVVALSHAIASRVTYRVAEEDRELILRTVRNVLPYFVDAERLVLRVNPQDLQILRENKGSILEQVGESVKLEVRPDDTVGRGGCSAHSETVLLDARLDAQLEQLLDALISG